MPETRTGSGYDTKRPHHVYSDEHYAKFHQFKKTVIFGYADLLAVGCRALLGLSMGYNYHSIALPELSAQSTVKCQRPDPPTATERYFEPFQILDCKYEDFTIVVINTEAPASKCHYIINHLLDLCRQSKVQKVIVLSCLRAELKKPYLYHDIYFENNFYMAKLTRFPSLPGDTPISDPMLNTILQMFKVEQIPLSIISCVGHKAHYGQSLNSQFAMETIKYIQDKLTQITGLEFDHNLSMSLIFEEYQRCHTMMGMYT